MGVAVEREQIRFMGQVQGVGFRAAMARLATRHAVTGWVRNEPDGSVAAEVQGDAEDVDALIAAIRADRGQSLRRVDRVPMRPEQDGVETEFVIRR